MAAQWKFTFVVGILLVACASARVVRDVATQAGDEHTFSKLFDEARVQMKTFEESLAKTLGFNNPEELRAKAADQGRAIANTLDDWTKNLKEQTESLKENSAVKELRSTIDKAVNDFKLNHPETATDLEKFVNNTKSNTEDIFAKIKTIGESNEAKQVKELSEKLLTTSVQALQDAAKKVEENLKQH